LREILDAEVAALRVEAAEGDGGRRAERVDARKAPEQVPAAVNPVVAARALRVRRAHVALRRVAEIRVVHERLRLIRAQHAGHARRHRPLPGAGVLGGIEVEMRERVVAVPGLRGLEEKALLRIRLAEATAGVER